MLIRFRMTWASAVAGTLAAIAILAGAGVAVGQSDARFEKEVVPIFRQHCVKCHGARPKRGGLDLSSAAGVSAGGSAGPVVVSGSADKSVLFEKVANRTMPPPEKKDP